MDYIRKIPLLMGIGAGLLTGIIGYSSGVPNRDNIANILLGMVIFYTAGIFIRSSIKNITEQLAVKLLKKEEEEKARALEKKRQEQMNERESRENAPGSKVDLVADDMTGAGIEDEDFDALPVADYIKRELK
jgi:divalent metal cation (Fe/Co/Zn/Cd) transporter